MKSSVIIKKFVKKFIIFIVAASVIPAIFGIGFLFFCIFSHFFQDQNTICPLTILSTLSFVTGISEGWYNG